jgi:putative redox protein
MLSTDAPTDNMGRGESFSPTDLVATALGTCILTIMGIVAQRHGIDIGGTTVTVTKEMVSQPVRRIGRLSVTVHVPRPVLAEDRLRFERAADQCPVKQSLHPDVQMPVVFNWA